MSVEIKDLGNRDIDKACREKHEPDPKRHDDDVCCVCKKVRFIDQLQKAISIECCSNCEAPKLGTNTLGTSTFNTRPFILYLPDGSVFETVFALDPTTHLPSAFGFIYRVEEVRDCCAVLRVLSVGGDGSLAGATFTGTAICVTVDLCRFVAIQCLHDTYITPC